MSSTVRRLAVQISCKTPGDLPEKGRGNGSSAAIAGAFGVGFPRPLTRDEALDGRAEPARQSGRSGLKKLRYVAGQGTAPFCIPKMIVKWNMGEKWPQNPSVSQPDRVNRLGEYGIGA